MPTYEYACRTCGEHLEVVQSFKDDALTECPACQGQLRKVFSAAGIIFKGSGWHVKDYSSASSRAASGPSSASSSDGSSEGASTSAAPRDTGSSKEAGSSASSTSSSSENAASA